MRRIKGCIVDSAPVVAPDPQVWASGFSAAFLKKNRVAAREVINANEVDTNALVDSKAVLQLGSPNLQLPNYVIPLMIQIILGPKQCPHNKTMTNVVSLFVTRAKSVNKFL
ncbi:hypothetical protein EZV62_007864 [Acer yangbiense]|uniref:Uncharacterized protein n=1 Tax=Acer yangbiense TaxID=1000413 RepID=A0A5C7ICJ4_9ROSI|nr:hypothetical protein EZV62_007864 [Acer yangbiense]